MSLFDCSIDVYARFDPVFQKPPQFLTKWKTYIVKIEKVSSGWYLILETSFELVAAGRVVIGDRCPGVPVALPLADPLEVAGFPGSFVVLTASAVEPQNDEEALAGNGSEVVGLWRAFREFRPKVEVN